MAQKLVRTTVRLPEDLLERAKIQAIRDGMTLQLLVAEAIWHYLKGGRK